MKKNLVITILLIIVLCLGGYLVFDKVIDKKEEKVKDPIPKEDVELDTAIAEKFIDELINLDVFNILDRLSENGLTEENKLSIAIAKTKGSNSYSCNDAFDMNENNNSEYRPVSNKKWGCGLQDRVSSYSYDLVNEQYKALFGSLENANKTGIYTTNAYEYSSKINSYVSLNPYFGPIVRNSYYYNIESAKVTDNKLNIEISYLSYFPSTLGSNTEFKYTIDGNTKTFNKDEISSVFNTNKSSLPRLTFSYEKENENYILKSVN